MGFICLVCCARYDNNGQIGDVTTEGNAPWRSQGGAFLLLEKKTPFWSLRIQNGASSVLGVPAAQVRRRGTREHSTTSTTREALAQQATAALAPSAIPRRRSAAAAAAAAVAAPSFHPGHGALIRPSPAACSQRTCGVAALPPRPLCWWLSGGLVLARAAVALERGKTSSITR